MKTFCVEQYGTVWRLSATSYRRLLKTIADGREYNLDDFGKKIGEFRKVLDMTPEQASEELRGDYVRG